MQSLLPVGLFELMEIRGFHSVGCLQISFGKSAQAG